MRRYYITSNNVYKDTLVSFKYVQHFQTRIRVGYDVGTKNMGCKAYWRKMRWDYIK